MASSSLHISTSKRLEGKVAIITGAANGIGAATASLFARHGCKVIIADIDDKNGETVASEIGGTFIHCDVRKESDVKHVVDTTISKHKKLDIMFSNAGIGGNHETSAEIDPENMKNVFETNVFGAFFCAKYASLAMVPAHTGSIIFSASAATEVFGVTPHSYTASKTAILGLAKNVGAELGVYGIKVNCVSAYLILTKLGLSLMPTKDKKVAQEIVNEAANLKGGRVLTTEDVAEAALYLADDESSKYISGLNLLIDGGCNTVNVAFQVAVEKILGKDQGKN